MLGQQPGPDPIGRAVAGKPGARAWAYDEAAHDGRRAVWVPAEPCELVASTGDGFWRGTIGFDGTDRAALTITLVPVGPLQPLRLRFQGALGMPRAGTMLMVSVQHPERGHLAWWPTTDHRGEATLLLPAATYPRLEVTLQTPDESVRLAERAPFGLDGPVTLDLGAGAGR